MIISNKSLFPIRNQITIICPHIYKREQKMKDSVIILGAGGRFGRASSRAFLQRGWRVSVLKRSAKSNTELDGTDSVYGDVYDIDSLSKAIIGHDVIVNALNPPYTEWARDVPRLTKNVIMAAHFCKATVMIPGNIYNYGENMPSLLLESTPHLASTKKGKIRIKMEQEYAAAANKGLQTIILRGGDFIEKKKTGNWFDSHIMNSVNKGIFTYPGPLDRVHAWAFLPDMAQAMAQLAEQRAQFKAFEEFGFEGISITGQELKNEVEARLGRPLKLKKMPWHIMKIVALFSPMVREVLEMRYLWDVSHRIDGKKLEKALPEFSTSNFNCALKNLL